MTNLKVKDVEHSFTDSEIQTFLADISKYYSVAVVTKRQINEFVKLNNLPYPKWISNKIV